MDEARRAFLESLLAVPSPSGFETRGQRVWIDHVEQFADEVTVDDYGNAVATYDGGDGPSVALAGHADEIGLIVRRVEDDGYLRVGRIGGADRTVTRGRRVVVHADDGPLPGVVGQTAIHLRDDEDGPVDIDEQYVDVGAADGDEAGEMVSVGDPVTVATTDDPVVDLAGDRISARGLDNRVGVWAAAEGLRRAAAASVEATVHAVATVQEEVGLQGARMVGADLDPDAVVAVDVTHAGDHPGLDAGQRSPVDLGGGPAVARGSANHPVLVREARAAAAAEGVDVQLQASGSRTGTDADAFYVASGGTPALTVGVPNRYMHTPVEVVSASDLTDVARLLAALVERTADRDSFAVEV
jgi:endoglucanase